jgi:hypothetical protein
MQTLKFLISPVVLLLLITGCDNAVTPESAPEPAAEPMVTTTPLPVYNFPSETLLGLWIETAQACYAEAELSYLEFDAKTQEFLDAPSQTRLRQLQSAWATAHQHYAACRIFQQPTTGDSEGLALFRNQLDSWPIMGGFLDAVPEYPDTGLINDGVIALSVATLIEQHQLTDSTEVTLGFHALEFLLWGADAKRSYTDFMPYASEMSPMGFDTNRENRRRLVLTDLVALLLQQTEQLQARWLPSGTLAEMQALTPQKQTRFMLQSLSGFLTQLRGSYFNENHQGDLFLIEESPFSHTTRDDLLASLVNFNLMQAALVSLLETQEVGNPSDITALQQAAHWLLTTVDTLPPLQEDTAADWYAVAADVNTQALAAIRAIAALNKAIGLP